LRFDPRYKEPMSKRSDHDGPSPVVMKFGGSSVADLDHLRDVAARVVERARRGPVVVVVSAMGKTTDGLVASARILADPPPARELDMLLTTGERQSMALLAICIASHGKRAVSLTGSQCGIITDHQHGRARIVEVRPFRIVDELDAGNVVIVGGFQGVSYKREVTTLGRGGSDTTAVALAAALGADCEIYSDVDGVYSADPRDVPEARRLDALSYEEMEALSRAGAKVLHAQAVQLAQEREIVIYTRKTSGEGGQTVIRKAPAVRTGVRAVASDAEVIALRLEVAPKTGWVCPPKLAAGLGALGLLYLGIDHRGAGGLLSASQRSDASEIIERFGQLASTLGNELGATETIDGLALASCIGAGLEERPELLGQALDTLGKAGIEAYQIHTDSQTIAFLVPRDRLQDAVGALHARFVEAAGNDGG
jgi:aspartate kinase